jgi:hypothetical protein
MSEQPHTPDHLVQVVTDTVARQFPDVDRDTVGQVVRTSYRQIAPGARITQYQAILVQQDAVETLRHRH